MRVAYSPVKVLAAGPNDNRMIPLRVQNRFNFLDFGDVDLTWEFGANHGKVGVKLPPHGIGEIKIPLPRDRRVAGLDLILTATDPRGVEVARIPLSIPPELCPPQLATGPGGSAMRIQDGRVILQGVRDFSLPPPVPMVLPLNGEGGAAGPAGSTLSNEIVPFTPVPDGWGPVVRGERGADWGGSCTIEGETDVVRAKIAMRSPTFGIDTRIVSSGDHTIDYELTLKQDVNPRQWGLVFTLPRQFETLTWWREADGVWHPDDDIGRTFGTANAAPVLRRFVEEPRIEPRHPWALDANALGTADFRSTKARVRRAKLSAADGASFTIFAKGEHAVRAWVDGDCIRLLVAGFNTGGSDHFFATHYAAERRPLKKGDVIKGSFAIGFTP
jgi:hypothetical protein